jgi:steroid delta-isomerase-like uncharacterized protein
MRDGRTVVLRHHDEIWSRGNVDAIEELYAPDFVGHHPGAPDWIGRDGVREMVGRVRRAFPDFTESVEDVVVDGDKVVTRFTASGTHLGPLGDTPPTGRSIRVAEMAICRVVGGQIAEKWGVVDRLSMFEQLGLTGGPGPRLELLYEITMQADVLDLGPTPAGRRRIVRVTGGTFGGPRLRGTVVPGGGDWLLERQDGSRALDVRITLQTDDGHLIYAHYSGRFHGAPDVLARITAGEDVPPAEYYFRTAPLFETSSEKYGWLNSVLGLAVGRRTAGAVSYTVYAVQ